MTPTQELLQEIKTYLKYRSYDLRDWSDRLTAKGRVRLFVRRHQRTLGMCPECQNHSSIVFPCCLSDTLYREGAYFSFEEMLIEEFGDAELVEYAFEYVEKLKG